MAKYTQLHSASFKNVKFLVQSESVTRGQKVAVHEYPNQDERFAESLGKLPPIFNLTCIIHGNRFIKDRIKFEDALESKEPGNLKHPVYGKLFVQAGEFSVRSDQNNIGKFIFDVTFYQTSKEGITPEKLKATPALTTVGSALAALNALNALIDKYSDITDGLNLSIVSDFITGALDVVQGAMEAVINPIQSIVAEVSNTIQDFRDGVFKIAATGKGLHDAIQNLTNQIKQLSLDPAALAQAWENMSNFNTGSQDVDSNGVIIQSNPIDSPVFMGSPVKFVSQVEPGAPLSPGEIKTAQQQEAENNKSLIAEVLQKIGLAGMMESSAHTNYKTESDLNNAIKNIDKKYNQQLENIILVPGVGSIANNSDVKSSFAQLRIDLKAVSNQQAQNAWKIKSIDLGRESMSLAAYRFYGNHDQLDTIIGLNTDKNVSAFQGSIQVVTK